MSPDRPNAPPELAAAIDTLDRIAISHIAQARVPTAGPHSRSRSTATKLRTNVKVVAPKVP